jgi:hypothetical protein
MERRNRPLWWPAMAAAIAAALTTVLLVAAGAYSGWGWRKGWREP